MKAKIAKLIDVKSIVTLMLSTIFSVLAARGSITADQFLTVYTTIIAFYFGTQYQKAVEARNDNNQNDEKEV